MSGSLYLRVCKVNLVKHSLGVLLVIGIELLVLNQQALLAVDRGSPEEGERLLRNARRLYLEFRERHPSTGTDTGAGGEAQAPPVPHSPLRLIDVLEAAAGLASEPTPSERDAERRRLRWIQFESNATLTLYYLAQVSSPKH